MAQVWHCGWRVWGTGAMKLLTIPFGIEFFAFVSFWKRLCGGGSLGTRCERVFVEYLFFTYFRSCCFFYQYSRRSIPLFCFVICRPLGSGLRFAVRCLAPLFRFPCWSVGRLTSRFCVKGGFRWTWWLVQHVRFCSPYSTNFRYSMFGEVGSKSNKIALLHPIMKTR